MAKQIRKLDIQEVAKRYDCHPRTIYRHIAAGEFPPPVFVIGKKSKWTDQQLDQHDFDLMVQARKAVTK